MFTDVIFENIGHAYHIFNEVNLAGNTTQDFIEKPTNTLKIIGKDEERNLLDKVRVVAEQLVIRENGIKSNKGITHMIYEGELALFADLVEGECTINIEYPGYKSIEKTVKIKPGMNVVEVALEK